MSLRKMKRRRERKKKRGDSILREREKERREKERRERDGERDVKLYSFYDMRYEANKIQNHDFWYYIN